MLDRVRTVGLLELRAPPVIWLEPDPVNWSLTPISADPDFRRFPRQQGAGVSGGGAGGRGPDARAGRRRKRGRPVDLCGRHARLAPADHGGGRGRAVWAAATLVNGNSLPNLL